MHEGFEVFHGCRTCKREKKGKRYAVCPEHLRLVRKNKRIIDGHSGWNSTISYVDLLEGKEQDDAMNEVEKWNPKGSFPTLVIR